MAGHTSEKRWVTTNLNNTVYTGVSEMGSAVANNLVVTLSDVEEKYQELLEIFVYAGGTNDLLAELLFKEDIAARSSPDNVPSVEELAKVNDLVAAMLAAHEIFLAANNATVTQDDRLAKLRRMS